jgi:hypothetical protein
MEAVCLFQEGSVLRNDLYENHKIAGSSPEIRTGQFPNTNGGAAQFLVAANCGWNCSSDAGCAYEYACAVLKSTSLHNTSTPENFDYPNKICCVILQCF